TVTRQAVHLAVPGLESSHVLEGEEVITINVNDPVADGWTSPRIAENAYPGLKVVAVQNNIGGDTAIYHPVRDVHVHGHQQMHLVVVSVQEAEVFRVFAAPGTEAIDDQQPAGVAVGIFVFGPRPPHFAPCRTAVTDGIRPVGGVSKVSMSS